MFLVGLAVMFFGLSASSIFIILFDLDNISNSSKESVVLGYVCLVLVSVYVIGFNGSSR